MSRYIDADALHETLTTKQKWVVRCGDKHNEGYTYDQVHFAVSDAPSIDIVRCKECVKRMREDCPMCNYCKLDRVPTEDDDFCSHGEREGE